MWLTIIVFSIGALESLVTLFNVQIEQGTSERAESFRGRRDYSHLTGHADFPAFVRTLLFVASWDFGVLGVISTDMRAHYDALLCELRAMMSGENVVSRVPIL